MITCKKSRIFDNLSIF